MITICPSCGGLNRIADINRIVDIKLNSDLRCGKCNSPIFSGKPVEMTGKQLLRALDKSDQPLVVDFWAPWCGPCKAFAPTFLQATSQLEPRAKLIKINTEIEQQVAGKFNIRSIPTLAIFKNGKEVARRSGAMKLTNFISWVNTNI
jgi:thioredoxin 2